VNGDEMKAAAPRDARGRGGARGSPMGETEGKRKREEEDASGTV